MGQSIQLGLPGIPQAPEPLSVETLIRLLPIEVTPKGAHLKVLIGWTGTYATVAAACDAAAKMGLVQS